MTTQKYIAHHTLEKYNGSIVRNINDEVKVCSCKIVFIKTLFIEINHTTLNVTLIDALVFEIIDMQMDTFWHLMPHFW